MVPDAAANPTFALLNRGFAGGRTHNGPTMMARVGVVRALNRHVERVFD
jgi:hypothetical protein